MKTLLLILALSCSVNAGQMSASSLNPWIVAHLNEGTGTSFSSNKMGYGDFRFGITNLAWVSGKFVSALAGNGASAYAVSGNDDMAGGEWSVSAWLKAPSTISTTADTLVCKNNASSGNAYDYIIFFRKSGDTLQTYASYTNTAGSAITNAGSWRTIRTSGWDTWFHYVGVFTQTTAKWYINGVLVVSDTFSSATPRKTSTVPIYIGTQRYVGANYWHTRLTVDEFGIFNKGLTSGEAQRLYVESLGRHSNAR